MGRCRRELVVYLTEPGLDAWLTGRDRLVISINEATLLDSLKVTA
jgi:hypothetical protein